MFCSSTPWPSTYWARMRSPELYVSVPEPSALGAVTVVLSVTSIRWSRSVRVAVETSPFWIAVTTVEVLTSFGPPTLLSRLLARMTSSTAMPIHTTGPRMMRLMSMDLGLLAPSLLPTTSECDRGDRPGDTRPSKVHRAGATCRPAPAEGRSHQG